MARRKGKPSQKRLQSSALPVWVDKAIALSRQADKLYKDNEYEQALALIQAVLDMLKPYREAQPKKMYSLKGHCLHRLGRIDEAVEALEQECIYDPDNTNAREFLEYLKSPAARGQTIKCEFDGLHQPELWPAVSLCMIVRNEEKHLADCLRSVGDFPGEIIVVDTGSTDRTVEIAKEFGARVEYFEWCDDFAAARNESIKHATGDWIFWMDADDRISPENLIRLKQAVASNRAWGYYCQVMSERRSGEHISANHMRLFANRLGIKFDGPVHEDAGIDMFNKGLAMASTNIQIIHTGYVTTAAEMRQKSLRNRAILEKCWRADPDNLRWQFYLGECLVSMDEIDAGCEHLEAVVAGFQSSLKVMESIYYLSYMVLISAYLHTKQLAKARAHLDAGLKIFSKKAHLWRLLGYLNSLEENWTECVTALEKARLLEKTHQADDYVEKHWAPGQQEEVLRFACLMLGNISAAQEANADMLAQWERLKSATVPEDIHQQAVGLVLRGQYQAATDLLEPFTITYPGLLRLLAVAYEKQEIWGKAALNLITAILLSEAAPGEWTKVANAQLMTRRKGSREYCNLALAQNKNDPTAHTILGIDAMMKDDLPQAVAHFVDALNVDSGHQAARNNLGQLAQQQNMELLPFLQQFARQFVAQADYNRAVDVLSVCVVLFPGNAESYKLLAVTLQQLGREPDAMLVWQTAAQFETQLMVS